MTRHFQEHKRSFLIKAFLVFLFPIMASIAACGFHLRGEVILPYKTIYIGGAMSQELRQYLIRYLETGTNAKVVTVAAQGERILNIISETNSQQILSYNSAGQITAYRLVTQVKFNVADQEGEQLLPDSDIYLTRDMDFSITTPAAAENLQIELTTDMRRDIVSQMLRRIGSLQNRKPK